MISTFLRSLLSTFKTRRARGLVGFSGQQHGATEIEIHVRSGGTEFSRTTPLTWTPGTLIASVLSSCYIDLLFTGNQALALILVGQMYLPVFKKRRIDNTVLTRSLEDAGTLSAPLVPWGVAGGFCSQMLGVLIAQYLPYVWLAFAVVFY